MSFTIVKDDGFVIGMDLASGADHTVLQVRATISTRAELEELIAKLTRYLASIAQEESHDRPSEPVRSSLVDPASPGDASAPPKEDDFIRSFRGD